MIPKISNNTNNVIILQSLNYGTYLNLNYEPNCFQTPEVSICLYIYEF